MTGKLNKEMLDDQENHFTTFDLGVSAALISAGFELIFLDKRNPRKVLFCFREKEGLEEAINNYFAGKLLIDARSLFDNIKALKNRIYSSM